MHPNARGIRICATPTPDLELLFILFYFYDSAGTRDSTSPPRCIGYASPIMINESRLTCCHAGAMPEEVWVTGGLCKERRLFMLVSI